MTTARQSRSGRPYRRLRSKIREQSAATGAPCHLCGRPIDYSLKHPHKMAFTLDHLQPVWAGGADDDPANYAPAHHSCNSRRGAMEGNRRRGRKPKPYRFPKPHEVPEHTSARW